MKAHIFFMFGQEKENFGACVLIQRLCVLMCISSEHQHRTYNTQLTARLIKAAWSGTLLNTEVKSVQSDPEHCLDRHSLRIEILSVSSVKIEVAIDKTNTSDKLGPEAKP